MISKISKLLAISLSLAVIFNNSSYSMEDINTFKSILFMDDSFPKRLNDIQNNKKKLESYKEKLDEYKQEMDNNTNELLKRDNGSNYDDSISTYIYEIRSKMLFNSNENNNHNLHKFVEDSINQIEQRTQQMLLYTKKIKQINNEISNIKKEISNIDKDIKKQVEEFYNKLIGDISAEKKQDGNLDTILQKGTDNEFEVINNLLKIDEIKNYIITKDISGIETTCSGIKNQFIDGLYGNFDNKDKFLEAYKYYINNTFNTSYYKNIDEINNVVNAIYYNHKWNDNKRNILDTIREYMQDKKQLINEKKEKALAEGENIFNKIKKNNQNNIEEDNNINEENINNNEDDNNIDNDNNNQSIINNNNDDNDINDEEDDNNVNNEHNNNINNQNNINEENENNENVINEDINNNDNDNVNNENEINENAIHENNINVVNDNLLLETMRILLEGGHSEERQYEQFKEFCDYFFANNGDNIRNILINSNDDQLDYLLTILNISNELQEKLISKYMNQDDLDIAQVMDNVYNIQSNNEKVNTIIEYISNIQFI